MESNKPKDSQAFPLEYEEYNSVGLLAKRQEFGMTLRDYFAAKAMQGTFSNPEATEYMSKSYGKDLPTAFERIADKSYRMAEAMLKRREL